MNRKNYGPYTCIYREIWNKEKFLDMTDDSKLIFLHLMTTSHGTQFGFFKMGVAGLADEIDWEVDRYQKATEQIIEKGHIRHDPKTKTWLIKGYMERNPPCSLNVVKAWGTAWNALPNCELKMTCRDDLRSVLESARPSFVPVFLTAFFSHNEKSLPPKGMPRGMDEEEGKVDMEYGKGLTPKHNNNGGLLPKPLPRVMEVSDPPEQYSGSGSGSGSEEPTVLAHARDHRSKSKEKYEYDGEVVNLSQQIVAYAVDRFGDWPQSEIEPSVMKLRSEYPDLTMPSWSLAIDEAYREAPPGARPFKYHEILYRKIKWVIAKNAKQDAERVTARPTQGLFWLPDGMSRPRGLRTALDCLALHREERNYPVDKLDRWEKEIKARG